MVTHHRPQRVTRDGLCISWVGRSIKSDKHLNHDVITLLIETLFTRCKRIYRAMINSDDEDDFIFISEVSKTSLNKLAKLLKNLRRCDGTLKNTCWKNQRCNNSLSTINANLVAPSKVIYWHKEAFQPIYTVHCTRHYKHLPIKGGHR